MADDAQTSLQPQTSHETAGSLLQLDPIPIAADPEKELPPIPAETDGTYESAETATTLAASTGSLSKTGTTASAGSLGLTSSGHGAVYYLSRVQRYSSYAFAIFTSVHLVTTSLVPLATRSVESSESYLLLAREIYQTRVSEPLLVTIPILAHVGAGIALRLVRRSQNLRRYGSSTPAVWPLAKPKAMAPSYRRPGDSSTASETGALGEISPPTRPWWSPQTWLDGIRTLGARLASGWPSLSIISASGYAFAVFLAGHIIVNRVLPLAVEGDSADIGLAYIAHGFARHPVTTWLTYTFFLAVSSGHMVWGWARWLTIAQRASWGASLLGGGQRSTGNPAADKAVRRRRRRTWLVIQGGVLIVFVAWAAGGLGVVARGGRMPGWVGDVYDGLYDAAGL